MNSETQLFSYYCFFLYYCVLVCICRFVQTIFWVIIIIHYNYIALFWVLKALYIEGGKSPEPSTNGSHIAPERPPHTILLVERRPSDEANQCMGMIRRPWWSEGNGCQGYAPTRFLKDILGFLMTTESHLGLTKVHPKDVAFYSIVSHTDHRVSTPCWSH